ncbi:peptidyl-prolyl cis-trans isomerase [Desulfovibrio sp. OttesenSCG-928-C14]|nr:peptidyl-prolyl cis-trans isomerase [Desulfovibrio sp. OttesenSCG-928-C14]
MRKVSLFFSLCLCFCLFAGAASAQDKAPEARLVRLETSLGNIVIKLDDAKAPKTCANFRAYVREGFYDGTIFHRVIDNFMIQGGGFDMQMRQKKTLKPILNEADNGLKNNRYTVAMARTGDPHSATAQFFINVKDNDFLNFKGKNARGWGYCVFGAVIEGQDVVDKIKKVSTRNYMGQADVPSIPVVIKKASLLDL